MVFCDRQSLIDCPPWTSSVLLILCLLQEDDDCNLLALQLLRDSLAKAPSVLVEDLARLGIPVQLQTLAGPPPKEKDSGEKEKEGATASKEAPAVS